MRLFKQLIPILSAGIIFSLFSCDRIEHPIPVRVGGLDWDLFPAGDSADYTWPIWTPNTNTLQNVLLEDFTGHTCTNCPAAATIAKNLEAANPGRVIIASIHASIGSSFQATSAPDFLTDYTTEEGDTYANEIPSFFGNPSGTINRLGGGLANTLWYLSSAWTTKTTSVLGDSPKANLQVKTNYYPQTRGLFVHTESEFLTTLTSEYAIVIYLIRKAVVSSQKLSNGTTDLAYVHHNVMSSVINGTWGTTIGVAPVAGEKVYNNFAVKLPDGNTDSTFNTSNLSLITYVYNKSNYAVLQVIQTDL